MSTPKPPRRVLVTGGAGFIGSHIVDALVARGDAVTVLDDLSSGRRDQVPTGVPLIEADIARPETRELVAGARPALVIHAAAQVSVPLSIEDPVRDRVVNLEGTRHVLQGAIAAGAHRFVFISSGGAIYGEAEMASETTPPAPQNPYGTHKLAAEALVAASAMSYGIVRFSNVYGPRQRAGLEGAVVASFVDALRAGRPVMIFGDGRQVRDLLYVGDAVTGTLAVADAVRDGTWNVATGVPTTVLGLLEEITLRLGPPLGMRHAPRRAGDVKTSSLTIERIRLDLGWQPTYSLRAGLREMLEGDEPLRA